MVKDTVKTLLLSRILTRIKVNNYMLAMCLRVGYRLRILSKREDVLGGKGQITNTIKDPLLAYYAIAIRTGKNNLKSMQPAPKTTLFHVDSHKREQLALGILYPGYRYLVQIWQM